MASSASPPPQPAEAGADPTPSGVSPSAPSQVLARHLMDADELTRLQGDARNRRAIFDGASHDVCELFQSLAEITKMLLVGRGVPPRQATRTDSHVSASFRSTASRTPGGGGGGGYTATPSYTPSRLGDTTMTGGGRSTREQSLLRLGSYCAKNVFVPSESLARSSTRNVAMPSSRNRPTRAGGKDREPPKHDMKWVKQHRAERVHTLHAVLKALETTAGALRDDLEASWCLPPGDVAPEDMVPTTLGLPEQRAVLTEARLALADAYDVALRFAAESLTKPEKRQIGFNAFRNQSQVERQTSYQYLKESVVRRPRYLDESFNVRRLPEPPTYFDPVHRREVDEAGQPVPQDAFTNSADTLRRRSRSRSRGREEGRAFDGRSGSAVGTASVTFVSPMTVDEDARAPSLPQQQQQPNAPYAAASFRDAEPGQQQQQQQQQPRQRGSATSGTGTARELTFDESAATASTTSPSPVPITEEPRGGSVSPDNDVADEASVRRDDDAQPTLVPERVATDETVTSPPGVAGVSLPASVPESPTAEAPTSTSEGDRRATEATVPSSQVGDSTAAEAMHGHAFNVGNVVGPSGLHTGSTPPPPGSSPRPNAARYTPASASPHPTGLSGSADTSSLLPRQRSSAAEASASAPANAPAPASNADATAGNAGLVELVAEEDDRPAAAAAPQQARAQAATEPAPERQPAPAVTPSPTSSDRSRVVRMAPGTQRPAPVPGSAAATSVSVASNGSGAATPPAAAAASATPAGNAGRPAAAAAAAAAPSPSAGTTSPSPSVASGTMATTTGSPGEQQRRRKHAFNPSRFRVQSSDTDTD